MLILSYNTTPAEEKSPWGGSSLPCSQRLSTTWLDHAVSVLHDHIFRSAAFGLTTSCFFLPVFCLRLLPPSCYFDRFLGDHLCFLEVRVLTTFLTIVRCGLHGNSSTREHQNVRFSRQDSTKKHYLALEKHKNRSWGKARNQICLKIKADYMY